MDEQTGRWTDGQTDGQKKWHIEVGSPPKKLWGETDALGGENQSKDDIKDQILNIVKRYIKKYIASWHS